MSQCIVNVPLWNDWSKVTYSYVYGSPILKISSFKSFNWICATIFAELIFCAYWKLGTLKTFWREHLVFHWRKISYLNLTYISSLVLSFLFTWDSLHARLNSLYKAWSYKKKKHKKIMAHRKCLERTCSQNISFNSRSKAI